jgi:hypothetical protein
MYPQDDYLTAVIANATALTLAIDAAVVLTFTVTAVAAFIIAIALRHFLGRHCSRCSRSHCCHCAAAPVVTNALHVDCSKGALAISVGQKVVLSFNGYWGKRSE